MTFGRVNPQFRLDDQGIAELGNVYYNLIEMAIGAEINGKLVHQPEGQVPLLEQTTPGMTSPTPIKKASTAS